MNHQTTPSPHAMVCPVALSGGKTALVSPEDYVRVAAIKWWAVRLGHTWYAEGNVGGKQVRMHRFIMNPEAGLVVDHRNFNGLDNRRDNLRICTRQENNRHRGVSVGRSRFHGVQWNSQKGKWKAALHLRKLPTRQILHIGFFADEAEAARAYDQQARIHFGEFAALNFPEAVNG